MSQFFRLSFLSLFFLAGGGFSKHNLEVFLFVFCLCRFNRSAFHTKCKTAGVLRERDIRREGDSKGHIGGKFCTKPLQCQTADLSHPRISLTCIHKVKEKAEKEMFVGFYTFCVTSKVDRSERYEPSWPIQCREPVQVTSWPGAVTRAAPGHVVHSQRWIGCGGRYSVRRALFAA